MRLPKAITFDCYGTLIDWESAVADFFARLLQQVGRSDLNPRQLQRDWEEIQFRAIQGPYRPYRLILRDTMAQALQDHHLPYSEADADAFAASMGTWAPFPDTVQAVRHLQKHVRVVLITNTDDTIIQETQRQLGLDFDDIITAEQAHAYKPDVRPFKLAQERLNLSREAVWHAGFGFKYDVLPASRLGMTTVWINRQRTPRPGDGAETLMVGDLQTLAWVIEGLAAQETGR